MGLPQNLAGLIGYLILAQSTSMKVSTTIITYVERRISAGCLWEYSFHQPRQEDWLHDTRIHEYILQFSRCYGSLYFFVIGIPSGIWCNFPAFVKYRKEKNVSYYWLYCEGWANLWGRRWAKEDFVSEEMLTRGNFGKPLKKLSA